MADQSSSPLSAQEVQRIAREILRFDLSDSDARACQEAIVEIRDAAVRLGAVPLPFADPRTTDPTNGTRWLEEW